MDIPWLRQASTTRAFSSPNADRREELIRVKAHLGADETVLVCAEQKHTSNIGIVSERFLAESNDCFCCFKQTDAIVCPLPNVSIAIMTADCAPIFLVDPVQKVIALAHAGWKGTLGRIAAKTVVTMTELGCSKEDLIAWVGPMAGGCCYEVSNELIETFQAEFSEWPVKSSIGTRNLDLVEINCRQLENAGLLGNKVHRSNICTIHNTDTFYSYRADNGTHGRIISAMVMIS